jgi:hypothetical protein
MHPFSVNISLVRMVGFEPTISCSQNKRAARLRYTRLFHTSFIAFGVPVFC